MSTHAPDTRSVSPWRVSPVRVPVPTPEVVTARPLLAALHAALGDEAPPCAAAPDLWTSGDEADLLVAAEHCHGCPARKPCQEYGTAIAATCGVFGGIDRTVREGRRGRRQADDTTEMRASA